MGLTSWLVYRALSVVEGLTGIERSRDAVSRFGLSAYSLWLAAVLLFPALKLYKIIKVKRETFL